MNKRYYILGGIVIGILSVFGYFAYANPIELAPTKANTTATTTATYATPGTGTTTVIYDAYKRDQSGTANDATIPIKLSVFAFLNATTGSPTLGIACEYSNDGIDYYKGDCASNVSTTTSPVNLANMVEYQLIFASSTCASSGNQAGGVVDCFRAFPIQTFTRFTKVFGYLSSTTAISVRRDDGAIRLEIVPQKERN